jgi:heme/copper-type cytochrome/quinol oxidase subunit 2
MEAQHIFNSQIIWFMIIMSIIFSTILVIMFHLIIKYMNLKKIVNSQQKLLYELSKLEIQKTKQRIKNGEI